MAKKSEKTSLLRAESIMLADQVIEAKDNKKSLIGIFNQIFVEKFPAMHPSMTLFSTLVGESNSKHKISIKIISPSGQEKFNKNIEVTLSESGRTDLMLSLNGLPLEDPGEYEFLIENESKKLAQYQLLVVSVRRQSNVVN